VLSLVAVSPQGFRGNPLSIAANVQSAAAQTAPLAQGDTEGTPLILKTA